MPRGLPVILRLEGKRCVVVGGGAVAARRARALVDGGAVVTMIAPRFEERPSGVTRVERGYQRGDLDGAALVVVATDDPAVNEEVSREARDSGILLNRADDAEAGDVAFPAQVQRGPVTIAVHTGGISASAAAAIRDQLAAALDPDWPRLLELVEPFRAIILSRGGHADRRARLLRLTDEAAMTVLKREGESALREHLRRVTGGEP